MAKGYAPPLRARGERPMDKPPLNIVPYDTRWPRLYETERRRILGRIGTPLEAIEHIGSTAVPGLAGKPIIDIMAGLRRLSDAHPTIEPLASLGYEYVPEHEVDMPERRYFRKGPPAGRTHHLHMVEVASEFWERHILFRDYLRTHGATAQEYEALKRRLAREHGRNPEAYTDEKSPFIQTVVERASQDTSLGSE